MADLGLADAVDAAEALLDPVRVPGQVVVHHEVGALEVDALARGVGRDEDEDVRVLREGLLDACGAPRADTAVDRDDRLGRPRKARSLLDEVVERVAVLGEDDQLAGGPVRSNISGVSSRRPESSSHFRSVPDCRTCSASASSGAAWRSRARARRSCAPRWPRRRLVLESPRAPASSRSSSVVVRSSVGPGVVRERRAPRALPSPRRLCSSSRSRRRLSDW